MNTGGILFYIAANLVSALMVGCMLFSAFVHSTHRFRVAVALLAAFSLGCAFLGLELFGDMLTLKLELGELAPVAFIQVLQSIALALVLVAMRYRQAITGAHLHPRQRTGARGRADGAADEIHFAP